jgi:hypothetical protein
VHKRSATVEEMMAGSPLDDCGACVCPLCWQMTSVLPHRWSVWAPINCVLTFSSMEGIVCEKQSQKMPRPDSRSIMSANS